jgi:hypothetical protein
VATIALSPGDIAPISAITSSSGVLNASSISSSLWMSDSVAVWRATTGAPASMRETTWFPALRWSASTWAILGATAGPGADAGAGAASGSASVSGAWARASGSDMGRPYRRGGPEGNRFAAKCAHGCPTGQAGECRGRAPSCLVTARRHG